MTNRYHRVREAQRKQNLKEIFSVTLWCTGFCPGYNAVMIAKDLLQDLVCPVCIKPLEYRQSPESLKCQLCHRVYAVEDDIPIMLVDQATIET